ncbi:hypothetical protein BD626DRAFT_629590 [Schizophyllum amplum]|uniref:Uncharacterized protein n=1 Tax=Schizophyllum amplum TaxID=97359 RepID=A0A550CG73_9AGAR|nr:hypothetical protein BD626DRAFT_629590 [Auriculariopsis ampla]
MPPKKKRALAPSTLERASELANIDMQRDGAVLSELQRQEIRASSAGLTAEIERLDAEAARIAATRRDFAAQLAVNTSLLAPIWSVPFDILCEIFLLVVAQYPVASRNFGSPAVALVCREWRAVALRCPRLWTIVNVPHQNSDVSKDIIQSYLSRSCRLPLDVHAEGPDWKHDWPAGGPSKADKVMGKLLRRVGRLSADRWRSLSVTGDIVVLSQQTKEKEEDLLPLDFLADAPRLREATLDVAYPATWPPMSFYGDALKSMTYLLRQSCSNEFMTITNTVLYQTELDTLIVLDSKYSRDIYTPEVLYRGPLVVIPKLDKLTTIVVSGLAHLILGAIHVSNLTTITVRDAYEEEDISGPMTSILRMMEESNLNSVRTLKLVRVIADSETLDSLYQCLEGLPGLDHLHIDNGLYTIVDSILRTELLAWMKRRKATAASRLPNLPHLALRFGAAASKQFVQPLRELMNSRKSGRVVDGVSLKALSRFTSDMGLEFSLP